MPKIAIVLFLLELYSNMALPAIITYPFYATGFETINTTASGTSIEISSIISSSLLDMLSSLTYLMGEGNSISAEGLLKNIFLLSSLLSLIIGTVLGLAQIRIKRLLAYSTISHVGFLLLALAIKTEESTESLLFYLIQYTITNLNTFFILLAFGAIINKVVELGNSVVRSEINYISELKKQFIGNPILSLSFAICLFSMAGMLNI